MLDLIEAAIVETNGYSFTRIDGSVCIFKCRLCAARSFEFVTMSIMVLEYMHLLADVYVCEREGERGSETEIQRDREIEGQRDKSR